MARLTREEARLKTREKLLDSGRLCFARYGFSGASVDIIAETAGFSKGAFYSNFDSKEAAFLLLLEQHLTGEIARGRAAIKGESFETALNSFVDLYAMEEEDQDWCLLSVEFALFAARSDTFGEHYSKLYKHHYEQIAETLSQIADLAGAKLHSPSTTASKFIAFRTGLALDRAAKEPTLTHEDVKTSLLMFLGKVMKVGPEM